MANLFKQPVVILIISVVIFVVFIKLKKSSSSKFTDKLISPISSLTYNQPKSFPPIQAPQKEIFNLAKPDVPEEIGLGMVYPQGSGVGIVSSHGEI